MWKMRCKRLFGCVCLWLLLSGCAAQQGEYLFDRMEPEAQQETMGAVQLILTHSAPSDSLTDQAAQLLREKVELYSGGDIQIQIYPEDSLGNLDDGRWYFSNGAVDMRIGAGPSAPASIALWLPLLADCSTQEIAQALQDGQPLRQLICQPEGDALALGILPPADRVMTSSRAVEELSDLDGLTMRVFRAGLEEDFWHLLGADTAVIPIGETYMGLQQGVADAQDNPIYLIRSYGFEQQQRYLIPIHFKVYLEIVYINDSVYQDLGESRQAILHRAVRETCEEMESITARYLEESWDIFQRAGLALRPVSDQERQRAREKVLPMLEAYLIDSFGEEVFQSVLATVEE